MRQYGAADRMTNLVLSEEVTAPERDVILAERGQVVERNPARRLGEAARASLFPHHPYGTPIIGWRHEMEGLTTEDALGWYETWYAPNNAILTLVGDIDVETARPLVEEHYGNIPAREVPERRRTQNPPLETGITVELRDATVRQPSWSRQYRAPSYRLAQGSEAHALQIVADLLGGGATSRLYRTLVVEQEVAVSAGAWYSPSNLDESTFGLYATPAEGVEPDELAAAIEDVVLSLLRDGATEEEVATSKARVVDAAQLARDSLMRPAYAFGIALTTGGDIAQVEQWPERMAALTLEDVNAAARAVLGASGHVTSVLLPASGQLAETGPAEAPFGGEQESTQHDR